jgi:hypothetical protein
VVKVGGLKLGGERGAKNREQEQESSHEVTIVDGRLAIENPDAIDD